MDQSIIYNPGPDGPCFPRLLEQFTTPYDQYRCHEGKQFEVVGQVDPATMDSEETGPMFLIRLETGEEIQAWPEEIYDL
jgi:hypothetical protein